MGSLSVAYSRKNEGEKMNVPNHIAIILDGNGGSGQGKGRYKGIRTYQGLCQSGIHM